MELEKLLTQKIKVNRSYRIDALKGIAIIAVVLYHFGGGGGGERGGGGGFGMLLGFCGKFFVKI